MKVLVTGVKGQLGFDVVNELTKRNMEAVGVDIDSLAVKTSAENARLNKILHLAQNMYIGKTAEKLIDADFYAYDNGGVLPEVQENYAFLLGTETRFGCCIDHVAATFLYKVFLMLRDAPIKKLIEIDHEDPAWLEKHTFFYKPDQIMDSMKYVEDYRDRYEAANFFLDRMVAL